MPPWIAALFQPIAAIFTAREQRKAAREAAIAKLSLASSEQLHKIELNKDEWESLAVQGLNGTWKVEYVSSLSPQKLLLFEDIFHCLCCFLWPAWLKG